MIGLKAKVDVSLVMAALSRHAAGASGRKSYAVTYGGDGVEYATIQHERTDLKHTPPGRAKWLESAARENTKEMARITAREAEVGALRGRPVDGLNTGLRLASEYLLERANETCPVDTGALKASGRVTEGSA
jgi:hypothetical protein